MSFKIAVCRIYLRLPNPVSQGQKVGDVTCVICPEIPRQAVHEEKKKKKKKEEEESIR